ncbi:Ankyrin repeat-containing domain protein [Elaphomyces granulatus]
MPDWPQVYIAARNGEIKSLQQLLGEGAKADSINHIGWTPLHAASYYGHQSAVELLVQHGASLEAQITIDGYRPLHKAAEGGFVEITRTLLKSGAKIEGLTHKNATPLYIAARGGHVAVVQLLLQAGANRDCQTTEGWTPLHAASYYGRKAVVELLVRENVNLELGIDLDGYRPLHKAAEHFTILNDKLQWTALHAAVYSGNKAVIRLLLGSGVNINAADTQGKTALDLAKSRDDQELVDLLLQPKNISLESSLESSLQLGNTVTAKTADSSKKWFQRVEELSAVLCTKRGDPEYRRARIAIIDSGMQKNHPYAQSVKVFRDFVAHNINASDNNDGTMDESEPSDKMVDLTQHGSTGVHLIGRLVPEADMYVARVFEHSAASADTQDLIAKAIRHAREKWKVDIITLASGFNQGHGGMEAEIRRANIEGILTFAAASNHGNTEYITFPANMTGHVMAMFASNGNATVTNEFNPAPSRHSLYNFALPGEQVRAHPFGDLQDGTSISTFIGAAIAGLVLDFANQRCGVENIRFREHLNKVDGTTAIFAQMAIGGVESR